MTLLKQHFKPYDYVFIFLSLLISFLPLALTTYHQSTAPSNDRVAIIKINGKVSDEFQLIANGPHEEKTYYPQKGHYNIIELSGDRIRVKEDNSPDQIAVKTGWISQPGQLSVCLPHQLVIEIQEKGQSTPSSTEEDDELILPL
ncbi:hypothetical protein STRIC_1263 [Streptococcus ictaluri 707-05]|uniref:Uncharacterized protein n=1 Tax=Streptococcus ictaluri 707-05 TaxID=764299 RepID=G5K395_9STRE|nr:NusG domain II-containing protein [Streptococcus ictaluri]EHI69474.1 hypothetical protein STRIC_1263 [Streptococcus ictaluri 707-05]